MTSTQNPAPGMDFWTAIGVGEETAEQLSEPQPAEQPNDRTETGPAPGEQPQSGRKHRSGKRAGGKRPQPDGPAADVPTGAVATAPPAPAEPVPGSRGEWAAMFSDRPQAPAEEAGDAPWNGSAGAPQAQPEVPAAPPATPESPASPTTLESPTSPATPESPAVPESPASLELSASPESRAASGQSPDILADPVWVKAEQIARSAGSQIVRTWMSVLTEHVGGDSAMAGRVYFVMNGWHLVGELWRDQSVNEVHIRGTQVLVSTTLGGVRQVPGFPDQATARRVVEAIRSAPPEMGAVVTEIGASVVVRRRHVRGPDLAALVAAEVITEEQTEQVGNALETVQTVTVTGPAAQVIVRAFASLVPVGSRVFEGPYGVLPDGCLAAESPLEADYVVGVRPGEVAEQMAAAGQLGGLIANPERQIPAAVRFVIPGRMAALGRLAPL